MWDDDDDDLDPTLGEAWQAFATALTAPARRRVERMLRWYSRLRTFTIDWSGFGYTRGGFFDGWMGTPSVYRPQRFATEAERATIRAAAGWCMPWQPPVWEPWKKWWPGFDYSIGSLVSRVQLRVPVARGGIVTTGSAYLIGEEG